jgi:hypothetical protein
MALHDALHGGKTHARSGKFGERVQPLKHTE